MHHVALFYVADPLFPCPWPYKFHGYNRETRCNAVNFPGIQGHCIALVSVALQNPLDR